MTDEYAKTLVIRDENYQPGQINPGPTNRSGEQKQPDTFEEHPVPMDYPSYEDTSWLT